MKPYLAELIGTFVLVFGGVGSAVLAGDKIGVAGIAFAFGLSLLVMAYAIGPISGCHINPAVTFGVLLHGRIKAGVAAGYVLAQIVGGVIGAAFVLLIAQGVPGGHNASIGGLGANGFGLHSPGHYSLLACFVAEIILTMFLVFTVLATTDTLAAPGFAGIPIGIVLAIANLIGIPITNASINPARSIGPAIFVGGWALSQVWLFIIAPLVGALVAAAAYAAIRPSSVKTEWSLDERPLASKKPPSAAPGRAA